MCLCEIYTEGSGATEEAREGEGIEPECADKRDYTENDLKELQKKIRAAALQKFAHPDPQETEEQSKTAGRLQTEINRRLVCVFINMMTPIYQP